MITKWLSQQPEWGYNLCISLDIPGFVRNVCGLKNKLLVQGLGLRIITLSIEDDLNMDRGNITAALLLVGGKHPYHFWYYSEPPS